MDEARSQPWEQFGVHRTWILEEIGDSAVLGLCLQSLNSIGAVIGETHRLFGAEVTGEELELDMLRTQTYIETDVAPSLITKWGWNDTV